MGDRVSDPERIRKLSYNILSPYNRCSKKRCPLGHRVPIDLHLGKEIDPPYPLVYRWRRSICWWLDGSTPLWVPAKKSKTRFPYKKWGRKRKMWVYKKRNRAWMGSGVIQMGWYFGKMTPRGSGSFLNRIFGLPRPKNIKKVLKYAWTPLGIHCLCSEVSACSTQTCWVNPRACRRAFSPSASW